MKKTIQVFLFIVAMTYIANAGLMWWHNGEPAAGVRASASTAGFLMLLPIGLMLINATTLPTANRDAADAIGTAIVIWVVAVLAYYGAGFALQFGGLAIVNPHPDFTELYWNWSPLDTSYGDYWGIIGLRGWALLGNTMTPGIFDLFLRHIALVGIVATIPAFVLYRRMNMIGMLVFGVLVGVLIYPLVGNWIWSGGWLSQLGVTQRFGHGFVDAGIATPFVMAGVIVLAARLMFRDEASHEPHTEIAIETDTFSLLNFFGLGLVLWSWTFYAAMEHIPHILSSVPTSVPRTALNGVLSALTGGLVAALYGRLTTSRFNIRMISQSTIAGLVTISTVAPFVVPWQAIIVGGCVGLLVPIAVYVVDHTLHLADYTGSIAIFALLGLVAWLLPGLLADGTSGIGWNGVGQATYLAIADQGVSGLWVAPGFVSDWPGQFNAQLVGAIIISSWAFLLAFVYFRGYIWIFDRQYGQQMIEEPDIGSIEPAQTG